MICVPRVSSILVDEFKNKFASPRNVDPEEEGDHRRDVVAHGALLPPALPRDLREKLAFDTHGTPEKMREYFDQWDVDRNGTISYKEFEAFVMEVGLHGCHDQVAAFIETGWRRRSLGDVDNDGDQDVYMQMGGAYASDRFYVSFYFFSGTGNILLVLLLDGEFLE